MNWESFTPYQSAFGGLLIGLSAAWMLVAHGRIAGISGIVGGLVDGARADAAWRVAFVAGLLVAGGVGSLLRPEWFAPGIDLSLPRLVGAGLLVGFGSRLGSGCTSGHGVCGLGRLSKRSLWATCTFIFTGVVTAWLVRVLAAGGA